MADLVANFMAITGSDDGVAIQMLDASNFNLEDAVQLFYAAEGNAGEETTAAIGGSAPVGSSCAAGQAGQNQDNHGDAGGVVRAPLPSKVERLYDFDPRAMYQYFGVNGRQQQPGQVDAFRDFRAETAAAAAASQAIGTAGSGAAPGASGGDVGAGLQGLSGLFKLPDDLVFSGNAELAKARAATEGKWLLLNVQSTSEFASHLLNRDTWSHEALKDILKATFVFYQTRENSPDGRALIKSYHLDSPAGGPTPSLPVILVVDPLTGAKMWHRSGFVDAEQLMEALVPFLDYGPLDAGASGLAQNNMMRKVANTAAAVGSVARGSGTRPGTRTEDEELALAIAMSIEQGEGEGGAAGASPMEASAEAASVGELEDPDDAVIWEHIQAMELLAAAAAAGASARPEPAAAVAAAAEKTKTHEEVAAEALARVPAEPSEGDPEALRVAMRMPDGTRVTRRFRRADPVRVLFDFGAAHVPEVAAGRSLVISHASPGGQALSDPNQSLDAAGVAGAMLAVKLSD